MLDLGEKRTVRGRGGGEVVQSGYRRFGQAKHKLDSTAELRPGGAVRSGHVRHVRNVRNVRHVRHVRDVRDETSWLILVLVKSN